MEIQWAADIPSNMTTPRPKLYCNATWDTLYCWPATEAGSVAKEMCATVFTDIPDLVNYPDAYAFRECGQDGVWMKDGWTNYSQCLNVIDKQGEAMGVVDAVRYITFIGAILSLVTLAVTFFIFTYFRTLECDRLRVHRNLVVSLIILFIVMLVLTEPFVSNRQTISYRDVDWLCKTLLAIRMYAQMASINWMFVEGLFLHSRLTSNVFDSGAPFPLYYTIGWGAPLVFIVAWSVTMALHYPVRCWMSYSDLTYVWILVAPMFTTLMSLGSPWVLFARTVWCLPLWWERPERKWGSGAPPQKPPFPELDPLLLDAVYGLTQDI
ncbi:calcitonin gene-related peptide type 1 receptor-like [Penaeus chinensis]|uniref:calcitonin gene-related peptide type 1 receptor-like n=1 Tax=Penaeus chinensis TaxID=139456 RepID=UPI001FB6185E|nr:calcitonin gene-related peptide type 1 receptor-like [Penaeus chinensis]